MREAKITNRGGREKNEDAIGRLVQDGIYCAVLADGLGGHSCGEVASRLAVDIILQCFKAQSEVSRDIMYAYLEAAQNAIIEEREASPEMRNMATTVAAIVTDGKNAVWAHCGDSRIYRFKRNKIQEVSEDHSVAFASFKAGDITYDEIRKSPDQNKLTRTLSNGEKFNPDISKVHKLSSNTVFLLCSDGLWEYVDEDFMEKSLKNSTGPAEWLKQLVDKRQKEAPINIEADNYSAIALFV